MGGRGGSGLFQFLDHVGRKAGTDMKRLQGALQSCSILLQKARAEHWQAPGSSGKCQYSELPMAKATTVEVFEMSVIITAIETSPSLPILSERKVFLGGKDGFPRRVFLDFPCPGGACNS